MRVALVNFAQPPGAESVEEVLEAAFSLVDWAEALGRVGATVEAVQGYSDDVTLDRNGVRYHLVAGPFQPFLHPRRLVARAQRLIASLAPDVVHVNSLLYARQAHDLERRLPNARIVLQHHAEQPPWDPLRRGLARRWLRAADAFVFTGSDCAAPWRAAGLLPASAAIASVAEGSSWFRPADDRMAARRALGMAGDPLLLSLGSLDTNKDPITLLRGLEDVLEGRPHARAVLCFKQAPLLRSVENLVAARPALKRAVRLLGQVPYRSIEPIVRAADVLIQGSHHEGSSYAVLDAMACGVVPVVTDIPSLRFLTGDGAVGKLWPAGDAGAFSRALQEVLDDGLRERQAATLAYFERHLSYDALAGQMLEVYRGQ